MNKEKHILDNIKKVYWDWYCLEDIWEEYLGCNRIESDIFEESIIYKGYKVSVRFEMPNPREWERFYEEWFINKI